MQGTTIKMEGEVLRSSDWYVGIIVGPCMVWVCAVSCRSRRSHHAVVAGTIAESLTFSELLVLC